MIGSSFSSISLRTDAAKRFKRVEEAAATIKRFVSNGVVVGDIRANQKEGCLNDFLHTY